VGRRSQMVFDLLQGPAPKTKINVSLDGASGHAATVFAGGEGVALRSVTRLTKGRDDVPKHLCPLMDGLTPFGRESPASHRTSSLLTLVVVKQSHRGFLRAAVAKLSRRQIPAQPCDRGTAAAILYGTFGTKFLGSDTTVAISRQTTTYATTSGSFGRPSRLWCVIDEYPQLTILPGLQPDQPETSYGWIEPGQPVCRY